MKKKLNIILSIILILGILLSGYGTYCMAFATNGQTKTTTEDSKASDGDGDEESKNEGEPLDLGNAKNEMSLSDDVEAFVGDEAEDINDAIVSIESVSGSYANGGSLKITLDGNKDELFGDLESGDIFLLDGDKNTPFSAPYILKVDSISGYDTETVLYVRQPELTEAFENIDIGFNDALKEQNLVSSKTVSGVDAYFVSPQSASPAIGINESGYTVQTLAAGANTQAKAVTVANDYSVDVGDFVIKLDVRLNEKQDNEFEAGRMEGEFDKSFNLTGEIGLKDLSAHMVVDMPSPAQFNELYFGLSGETYASAGLHGKIEGSFKPKETEFAYDGKFIDASISGLNEKAIPLGIWHFSGTTLIKVSTSVHEEIRMAPSLFLMLYSDLEGNISFDFGIDFKHSNTFNSGLRVFKEGKPWLQPEVYPYESIGGEIKKPEETNEWSVSLALDANLDLTALGTSVSFFIGGINIGEVAVFELGFEADCDIEVTGNKKDGVKFSDDNSFYIRMYLQFMELRARAVGDIEAFKREISFGGEMQFCLLDLTLFEKGIRPDKYKKTPVSSMSVPAEFDSVITIVGDVSGSMNSSVATGETKLEAARQAGKVIADMVKDWSERYEGVFGLGVIQFSDSAKVLAAPHIDYPFISLAIDSMKNGGGTNIASGIESAIAQLDATKSTEKSIILMTDGEDGNHTGITDQANIAKEKGIKIFTIGFGNGVNAELLTEVANITGGEYKFADTSNMVGIIGGFMYAYQSSQADVLGDFEGTVSQGETADAGSFKVPERSGDLNANLYWPGSFLELILIDPNDKKVDEKYPGAMIDESTIPSTVSIEDPIAGKWRIKVKGVETSYDQEPYYAITSFKDVERDSTERLKTYVMVGAYCIPIGAFMIITSVMFLILVNSKKRK